MKLLSAKFHCLLLIISSIITSCNNNEIIYPEGGYSYPTHVEDKDTTFYCYPLKDIKSTRDSFESAYSYNLLRLFDENNLSIKPVDKTTFRMIYCGGDGCIIIRLALDEIIVKRQLKGSPFPWHDTSKLNEKEKFLFDKFQRFFPFRDSSYSKSLQDYLDSLTQANRELFDANYYKYLLDKSADYGKEKFEYSLKRIPIKGKTFTFLVKLLNQSGYWKLPFDNSWCAGTMTHADGFILEANTPKKYNIIKSINCPDDTTQYTKACQEIINSAGMEKEIKLIWNGAATTAEPVQIKELKLTELNEEDPKEKSKKKKAK